MDEPSSITKDANQLNAEERQSVERMLGRPLRENERIFLRATTIPDPETRRRLHEEMNRIEQEIVAFQEKKGITEEEVNAAVDESVEEVRRLRKKA